MYFILASRFIVLLIYQFQEAAVEKPRYRKIQLCGKTSRHWRWLRHRTLPYVGIFGIAGLFVVEVNDNAINYRNPNRHRVAIVLCTNCLQAYAWGQRLSNGRADDDGALTKTDNCGTKKKLAFTSTHFFFRVRSWSRINRNRPFWVHRKCRSPGGCTSMG